MAAAVEAGAMAAPGEYVEAKLVFVLPSWRGKAVDKQVEEQYVPKMIYHAHPTRICNARPQASEFSLARNGFQLFRHEYGGPCDWASEADVRAKYFPAMLKWAKEVMGASETLPIYHMYRDGGQSAYSRHGSHYTTFVHGDISPAIEWVGGCPESGDERPWPVAAGRHFAIVNFWRPTGGTPVQNHHLAILDPATLRHEDVVPKEDVDDIDKSQHLRLVHSDGQRWLYFPHMMGDEVLAFTQYDTRQPAAAWRPTFHSAFRDPTCPEGAPARQSVEFRVLCLFGADPEAERRRRDFFAQFSPLSRKFQQAKVPFTYHEQLAANVEGLARAKL